MTAVPRPLLALVAAALLVSACGRSDASEAKGTAGEAVESLEPASIPAELLGLTVEKEDVAGTVAQVDSAFVDGLALYSLREDDLVQATLQVSRFNADADIGSSEFRQTIVNQIGSARPRAYRLGEKTVYLTTGTKQSIAVWFTGKHMFVLASRSDYDQPRTLLRHVLELQP